MLNRALSEALAYSMEGGKQTGLAAALVLIVATMSAAFIGFSYNQQDARDGLLLWSGLLTVGICVFLPLRVCADWKGELESGTLELLRASPMPRGDIVLGKTLVPLLLGGLALVCGIAPPSLMAGARGFLSPADAVLTLLTCVGAVTLCIGFATACALRFDNALTAVTLTFVGVVCYGFTAVIIIWLVALNTTPANSANGSLATTAAVWMVTLLTLPVSHLTLSRAARRLR